MVYATYSYYTDTYHGSALSESEFNYYAKRASANVDQYTFGRLTSMRSSDIPDAVRDATCAAAEKLSSFDKTDGGRIASENNDGYAVSYRDTSGADYQNAELYDVIELFLANTGLLYRGFSRQYDLREA